MKKEGSGKVSLVWGRAVYRYPQDFQFYDSRTQGNRWRVPSVSFGPQAHQTCQNCSPGVHRQTTWSCTSQVIGGQFPDGEDWIRGRGEPEKVSLWGRGTSRGPPTDPRLGNGQCARRQLRCVHTPQFDSEPYTVPGVKEWDPFAARDVSRP